MDLAGALELFGRGRRVHDVGDEDPRALLEEATSVGEAEPGRPAGDDGHLAFESHGITLPRATRHVQRSTRARGVRSA
jgi:hypothetical protein